VQAKQSELKSYASQADSLAASAAVRATQLRADAEIRSVGYTDRTLDSDEEALRMRIQGANYDGAITNFINELQKRAPELDGKADYAGIVTRYVAAAQEAVGRAAQLSQTANIQLAKAYADVYSAAGSAGAAVASGKLSGFRASASLSASDSLDANDSYTAAVSDSGGVSYNERINYSGDV
jgi:hypothetical protein